MATDKLIPKEHVEVLKKYRKPHEVESGDEQILKIWSSASLVGYPGFNIETLKNIACLTPTGKKHLNR